MLKDFLLAKFIPTSENYAILILRIIAGTSLFLRHGTEKIFHFSTMTAHFPNPIHIGAVPSLAFALLSDSICSLLVLIGLATRWAALIIFVNVTVAWTFVHHLQFFGPRGQEVLVLYMAIAAYLLLTGGGKYSVDYLLTAGPGKEA